MSSCVRFAAVLLWWFAGSAYPQFDPAFGIDGHASAGFAPAIVRATGATVVTPSGAVYLIGTVRNPSAFGLATAIAVARLTPRTT